jgi:two-component system LytT family sensor kinase
MLGNIRSYLVFAACWSLWGTLHAWALISLGLEKDYAVLDSVTSNVLLMLFCLATGFALRYYRPSGSRAMQLFLWVVFISGIWLWSLKAILPLVASHYSNTGSFLAETAVVRFCVAMLIVGCFLLLNWIYNYVRGQKEDQQRHNQMERLARETELIALRQQLHPHFLFNTLNSITALIACRPEEANKMTHQLSDFLRGTLRKDDRQVITLREELEHLNLYLEIEKVRFGHRLDTEVACEPGCEDMQLPVFLVQPIVENAVKFGLYDTLDKVTISIRAACSPAMLELTISNPYDAATAGKPAGTGFGLSSVKRRLYLLYGRPDLVEISTGEGLFIVAVKIPQHHDQGTSY